MEPKKNPKANLENLRVGVFLLGLTFAGAASLAALELIEVESDTVAVADDSEFDEDLEFDIEIPLDEEPPPEEEPPPPPEVEPPPAPPEDIEETDDEDEQTDANFTGDPTPPPPPPPPPPPKKVEIVDFPQQMAEFPGGQKAMYEYLGKNITYPKMAREAGIQGKVYVQFVVWKDGTIGDVKVLRGIGGGCDEEAVRVVKSMPKWTAAEQAGQKVNSRFMLPVVFKLQ